jgi:lactate dehydrogenase-like 2-hydroxyacid dehydrogenase
MNIAIFEVEDWEREPFAPLGGEHDLRITDEKLTAENAGDFSDAEIISTFIYSDLDRGTLEKFDRLKLIACRSTGFDHVDLETCKENDVTVCIVPSYGSNTARGSLIDTKAMLRALAEGRLAAAGLDVLPAEPVIREEAELLRSVYEKKHDLEMLLADTVMIRMGNVVVTPHSAFNTREAVRRIVDTTVDNIGSFARGEPENTVDLSQS